MQILNSLRILTKYWWLFVLIIIIPVIIAVFFANTRADKYTTSISFTVNRINKQPTTEYQFDGYYALQASDLFSDTVVSWFLTPSVIVEMYDKAGLNPDLVSLSGLTSRFKIKKYSSQNLVVKFASASTEDSAKLATAVINIVETKSAQLNQSADRKALFEVIGAKPVTVQDSKQLPLVGFVGLVIGLFLAVIVFGGIRTFAPSFRQQRFEV